MKRIKKIFVKSLYCKSWYVKSFLIFSVLSFAFASCASIYQQEMAYLGDESILSNVSGSTSHIDWLGIGVDAEDYIREYNAALDDAFRKAPSGTTEIVNLKAFRQVQLWPQVVGSILVTAGSAVASTFFTTDSITVPLIASGSALVGAIFSGINIYDFVLIGEPVVEVGK